MGNNSAKRYISICIFGIIAAIALFFSISYLHMKTKQSRVESLCDYDIEVFDVLLGGAGGNNLDAQDALRLCPSLITTLRYGEPSDWTEEVYAAIDTLMEQFYEYGYLPREPYEGLGDYVTSMDAPLLAVTSELAYERSGDARFRRYMEDLIPYIVSDTTRNGFVLKLSDTEWWPLEYAWTTVSEEDGWFVLNGSLYGMVCVEMLESLTGDPRLTELSEKALNAYQRKIDEFLYPDGTWCYYALNSLNGERVINRVEKILIETRALKALYFLTGNPFYKEQLDVRSDLLAAILPVYIVESEDTHTAMLLRASAPHPYMVETYPSTLELLDAGENVVTALEAEDRLVGNSYISATVPDGIVSYRLYGQINPVEKTLIAEAPVKHVQKEDIETETVSGEWTFGQDSVSLDDGLLTIDPTASDSLQARIYFKPDTPQPYTQETYWVVEFENLSSESFPMTGYLYDQTGTVLYRTLLPCTPGKSIQVLSPLGYKDYSTPLEGTVMAEFAFITNIMEQPRAEVHVGNIYAFHSAAEVVNYLSRYNFTDFWTIQE